MAEIEIKSSLINDKDFRFLKNSLIEVSKIDGKDKFRVKCIEYINDSAGDDEDIFFYVEKYELLNKEGIMIMEVRKDTNLKDEYLGLKLYKEKRYGISKLLYYKKEI